MNKALQKTNIKLKKICTNNYLQHIYISDDSGSIFLIDIDSGKYIGSFKISSFKVKNMTLCAKGKYLAVILSMGSSLLLDIKK